MQRHTVLRVMAWFLAMGQVDITCVGQENSAIFPDHGFTVTYGLRYFPIQRAVSQDESENYAIAVGGGPGHRFDLSYSKIVFEGCRAFVGVRIQQVGFAFSWQDAPVGLGSFSVSGNGVQLPPVRWLERGLGAGLALDLREWGQFVPGLFCGLHIASGSGGYTVLFNDSVEQSLGSGTGRVDVLFNERGTVYGSVDAGIRLSRIFSNMNALNLDLGYSYGFRRDIIQSTYQVTDPNGDVFQGTISSRASSFNVSFGYMFTWGDAKRTKHSRTCPPTLINGT